MRALFAAAIFLGSALLFLIQPMFAKMLLPHVGGASAVSQRPPPAPEPWTAP